MSHYDEYPNGHLLISPEALRELLGEESLVILDVRGTHELIGDGWIPGAAHLDLYGLGTTKMTPEVFSEWIAMMRFLFAIRGIGLDRRVVIYGATSGVHPARAFWLLEYLGHESVQVLDGGIKAWIKAGLAVSREMTEPIPRSFKPRPRPEIFISADDLHARLGEPGLVILDTRGDDEYYARQQSSYRQGAIPGAIHLEWIHYLDQHRCFKPAAELTALFADAGITREKPVVPY